MNDFSTRWVNLTSARLGAIALGCSDEFFAPMYRMLKDEPPVFIDGKYDDHGKWMDGWESKRKRGEGHDWCIVKMARPGVIHAVEIDTTHFTGNYPPAASLEACHYEGQQPDKAVKWKELIPRTPLQGNSVYQQVVHNDHVYTHLRLHMYPDGGIARLRVYGTPFVDWTRVAKGRPVDIAAARNGGVALVCNNEHFGKMNNLLLPGRGSNMGDGWETRRRRDPGNDWVVIALARAGQITSIEIDTAHFKGNYPDRCSIQGTISPNINLETLEKDSESWLELLPQVNLHPDREHRFADELMDLGKVTHLRLNIYPDGGVSRLRVFAKP